MLHFSPRHGSVALVAQRRPMRLVAANDNPAAGSEGRDLVLATALRLFASHGLSAATQAGRRAREAASTGDEEGFNRWLAVCRALDRRLAREIEHRKASGAL